MALFQAYFGDRKDLNDNQVLADVAESIGLNRAEALAVLEDGRFAETVRAEEPSGPATAFTAFLLSSSSVSTWYQAHRALTISRPSSPS